MPQKYTSRVILILAVLILGLIFIFPPLSLLNSSVPWSQKLALKPGIDIAGGTKLVYEIKTPDGEPLGGNLSEQVMAALKKRVDPDGVRNLIWRPQGGNRLEIQMPLSAQSDLAQEAREKYSAAQAALDKTNIRHSDVLNAVEKLDAEARRQRFTQLEMGSVQRGELFGALASTYDAVKAAEKKSNTLEQAQAEINYDQLKSRIEETNLSSVELQAALEGKPDTVAKRVQDIKARYPDFPARQEAIDNFVKAWDAYAGVKSQLDDAGELKRLLKGSGVLEFHIIVQDADLQGPEAIAMRERLKPGGKGITAQPGDTMRWYLVDRPEDMSGFYLRDYNDHKYALAWTTPDKQMVNRSGHSDWALESARQAQTEMGVRAVGFRFNAAGGAAFSELTTNNLKKLMAVMLDDKIISAANIQSTISRDGIISRESGYTEDEFKYLLSTLNAGSLPARLADEPISEQTIEPQLGVENLRAGLFASMIGLAVVAVFLISYYHLAGLIATGAVLMNVVLILASVAAIDGTFTLPGIAGIVLTVGAAVDANVLIFERLREEQLRGMGLKMALRNAYQQAFSAILDSNVTTIITSLVLYMLGTEEVKGFGLTLLIGLIWSLFTALFVTKTVFGILIDKFNLKHLGSFPLSHPKWDKALRPRIDWMGKVWIFILISAALTIGGMVAFCLKVQQREILDIEFAGGTSVQIELVKDMPKSELEKLLGARATDLPSLGVSSLGKSQREYEIVTPNADARSVRDAVLSTLGTNLKLQVPSKFDNADEPADKAIADNLVVPVENSGLMIPSSTGAFTPGNAGTHVGGAAIILKNLDPAITPGEIKARITRQRLQPQTDPLMAVYRAFDVESPAGNNEPTTTAVVLVSDENIQYNRDPERWRGELVTPMWKLVNEAVNKPPQLQKVSNFGPQVASNTTAAATAALLFSIVAIMIYIWFRFGDLKYGTATVVAMLHDTLLVVGCIGLAHYLADTSIGHALMLEPFRVNLTIVAAILTVMSYSMIDTIVVFDRIRENRGKYGEVNREEINDSINQTLSRTILTGSTNIFTVFFMYVLGGPGIHGFTFALLIGIIVGTYSSIAIAAPMLLIGKQKRTEKVPASKGAAAATGTGK